MPCNSKSPLISFTLTDLNMFVYIVLLICLLIYFCPGPPLLCLRVLVPPARLISAAVWQTVQQRTVTAYGLLDDVITEITDIVPGLLDCRQRCLLCLNLRAQVMNKKSVATISNTTYLFGSKVFIKPLFSSAYSSYLICAAPVKPLTLTPFSHTWSECRHSVHCWTKRFVIIHNHNKHNGYVCYLTSNVSQEVENAAEGMCGPNTFMSHIQRLIADPDYRQHFYQVCVD